MNKKVIFLDFPSSFYSDLEMWIKPFDWRNRYVSLVRYTGLISALVRYTGPISALVRYTGPYRYFRFHSIQTGIEINAVLPVFVFVSPHSVSTVVPGSALLRGPSIGETVQ